MITAFNQFLKLFLLIFSIAVLQSKAEKSMTKIQQAFDTPDVLYKLLDKYRLLYGNLIDSLITENIESNHLHGMANTKVNELIFTFDKSKQYPHDNFDDYSSKFSAFSESICNLANYYEGNVYQSAFEFWINDATFIADIIKQYKYADANCQLIKVLGNDWMCVLMLANN